MSGVSLTSSSASTLISSASVSAISLASSLISSASVLAVSPFSVDKVFSTPTFASSIFCINSAVSASAFLTMSSSSTLVSSILADSLISSIVSAGKTDFTTLTELSESSTTNLLESFAMNSFCFSVMGT